jgi:hypothetical protein
MSNFQLPSSQRREVLLKARQDIEYNLYAKAALMGLDLDLFDPQNPGHSWNYTGVDTQVEQGFTKDTIQTMERLGTTLRSIIEKLEGPNRVI